MERSEQDILISVVVPCYNAGNYLRQCMESIVSQTHKNLQIICVDDGSTDLTLEILNEFATRDKRITVLRQEHKYAGVARNYGLEYAKGKYISFLDADDYFEPEMLAKMAAKAEKYDADVVICRCRGYDGRTQREVFMTSGLNLSLVPEKEVFSKADMPTHIFQISTGWAWDKLYQLDFVRKCNIRFQDIRVANDEVFVDIAIAEAQKIAVIEDELVIHRINVLGSLENTRDNFWDCSIKMLYEEEKQLRQRGLYEYLRQSFINRAAGYLLWYAASLQNYERYCEFYACLKNEAIFKLQLLNMNCSMYHLEEINEELHYIQKASAQEFLIYKMNKLHLDVKEKYARLKSWEKRIEARDYHIAKLKHDINKLSDKLRKKIWRFPAEEYPDDVSIIVYGYGKLGHDFVTQLKDSLRLKLVAIVDKEYENYDKSEKVYPPDYVYSSKFDYLVIAILDKDIVESVRQEFISKGIPERKIIWHDLN